MLNNQELFKFYESQYHFEAERRDKVDSRLQIPFAVMVTVIGLQGFMLQNISFNIDGMGGIIFWLLFSGSLVSVCIALFFFRYAWFGHEDKLIPTPITLEDYRASLQKYYTDEENSEKKTEERLKNTVLNYYIEFASANANNNDKRAFNIYRTTVSLTVAVIFAFLSYIPFHINKNDTPLDDKTYNVRLMNQPEQLPSTRKVILHPIKKEVKNDEPTDAKATTTATTATEKREGGGSKTKAFTTATEKRKVENSNKAVEKDAQPRASHR